MIKIKNIHVVFFLAFIFSGCGVNTKAYKIAKDYLINDSLVKSRVGNNVSVAYGSAHFKICENDIDNLYGGAFALFDIPVKQTNGEYIRTYVFLRKDSTNNWYGDSIVFNPDQETRIEIYKKYDF